MHDFKVSTATHDGRAVVLAEGDVDLETAPELWSALADAIGLSHASVVRLDCRRISFIDSAGISVLVRAHQDLTDAGRRFEIAALSERVGRPLRAMALDSLLNVEWRDAVG